MAVVNPSQFIDTNTLPRPRGFKRVNGSTRVMYYLRDPAADIAALSQRLEGMSEGRYRVLSREELANRYYLNHPAVASVIIETEPPRVFRRGGAAGSDLLGMHGYPASIEDMAAFLVAIGPAFTTATVIPEAHQLDIFPVATRMLKLDSPASVVSDGGALRDALKAAERE